MQNDASEFMDLSVQWKCSTSKSIIGTKDHMSIQMNVPKDDKMIDRFNNQFKTYATVGSFAGWVNPMTPSSDWPRLMASFQRTSDRRRSQMWDICHK
ncbi:unnamed protein product [Gulo gulo]|uniref:Uncharacterized protein n=1 Tax=Gulo gulo TaxID=48420 RepID=A0A9X9LQJ1_GULGU|nr:unnamed protein product [Gulo gulo]